MLGGKVADIDSSRGRMKSRQSRGLLVYYITLNEIFLLSIGFICNLESKLALSCSLIGETIDLFSISSSSTERLLRILNNLILLLMLVMLDSLRLLYSLWFISLRRVLSSRALRALLW